jgi:catechol 2,3-dioxygenase-like lactoylglutathione lyase family enzyme
VTVVFAGIPVTDYAAARGWYERLLGTPPDMLPHAAEAAWRLGEEGWVYVVADAPRAGSALVALIVDDLDAVVTGIAERGIEADETSTIPGAARQAVYRDPDGNLVKFGQPLRGG